VNNDSIESIESRLRKRRLNWFGHACATDADGGCHAGTLNEYNIGHLTLKIVTLNSGSAVTQSANLCTI